jgi:hypothetical protein
MMNIEKWIEENSGFAFEYLHKANVIHAEDLRELLKTHTLVPNEPTEEAKKAIWFGVLDKQSDLEIYKAMLSASKEQ